MKRNYDMREKRYYEEIKKYAELAQKYHFNSSFVNNDDFDNTRRVLIYELRRFLKDIEVDYLTKERNAARSGIMMYENEKLLRRRDKIQRLLDKITERECIETEDYINSYFELKFFGIFTTWQMIIMIVLCAVAIMLRHYFVG